MKRKPPTSPVPGVTSANEERFSAMTDIGITPDATGELMVVGVEGLTEAGEEFIDRYVPTSRREIHVQDVGHIVIHEDDLLDLTVRAKEEGLSVS